MSVYTSNKETPREDILSNPPFTRPVRPATCSCAVVPSSANPGGSNLIVFPGNLKGSSHLKVLSEIDWPR